MPLATTLCTRASQILKILGPETLAACCWRLTNPKFGSERFSGPEVCMSLCVQQFPSCKGRRLRAPIGSTHAGNRVCGGRLQLHLPGIEFSMGRCEIWTRPEGISAWAELNISGFTCMRFGRPTGNLLPAACLQLWRAVAKLVASLQSGRWMT